MFNIWVKDEVFGWEKAAVADTFKEAKRYAMGYALEGDVKIKDGNRVVVELKGVAAEGDE